MSVEALVIAALVDEGSPKRAFQAGISEDDFEIYDEEYAWIVNRAQRHKPITLRLFKQKFPDFDFILSTESLGDLLEELKRERAFVAVSGAIESILTHSDPLDVENAIDKAFGLREILGDILKLHAPQSDVMIKSGWETAYKRARELSIMRGAGESTGIPTKLQHFDVHFGGLQPETTYLFLGRPGDAKSFMLAKLAVEGAWAGYRMGFFSPEMTEHQHNCRFHTLLSAKEQIQQAAGLKGVFQNRALRNGEGFNLKEYKRFLQWLEQNMKGEICLFTQKYRREKMSIGYIESRIEDLGLDAVIIDPIYKLQPPQRRGAKWEELGEIVDRLVDLSHSYNIPVVMSNQANRGLVGKKESAPSKDSSFGADSPVQEANCSIGVKHYSEERLMKVRCDKNRDGEPFNFSIKFFPNIGVMEDISPIRVDHYAAMTSDSLDGVIGTEV